jgi:serine/threonine-protein kinase
LIGQTLSHFRITAKLGEGGMGEVYRAEDTKLGREVAIKVLPEAVASDPERLARFEREAKVLASLNHPHIAGIYQVEEADGVHFLVMELAAGEDLRERLARGPVPIAEALPMALQIAQALEEAHERGVIHRDLKPANVKIDEESGLAKALDPQDVAGSSTDLERAPLSLSPTLTQQMTGAGVILGTAAYMSPEQAKGKRVDRRADIWAFGVLLWEMLTGRRLFTGDSSSEILASVLMGELDLSELPPGTPLRVRRLIERCLRREPSSRLRDIGDARLALEETLAGDDASELPGETVAPAPRASGWRAALAVGLGIVLGAAAAALFLGRSSESESAVSHLSIPMPSTLRVEENPLISPDGRTVVFRAFDVGAEADDHHARLWLQRLDSSELVEVERSKGATFQAISPDGRWLVFTAPASELSSRFELLKVPIDLSTPPVKIADYPSSDFQRLVWAPSNRIFSIGIAGDSLMTWTADGGAAVTSTPIQSEIPVFSAWLASVAPDGHHLIVYVGSFVSGVYRQDVGALDTETGELRIVVEDGSWASVLADGYLLFSRRDTLMAAPIDVETLELTAGPVAIMDGLWAEGLWTGGTFNVSSRGDLIYPAGGAQGVAKQLTILDRQGNLAPWSRERLPFNTVSISPDGRRLATQVDNIAEGDALLQIRVSEIENPRLVTVGSEAGRDCRRVAWSPDSQRLAYDCVGGDSNILLIRDLAAGGPAHTLYQLKDPDRFALIGFAAGGARVLLQQWTGEGDRALVSVPGGASEAASQAETLEMEETDWTVGGLSPDGKWLAYISRQTGRRELFIREVMDGTRVGPRQLVASDIELVVTWSKGQPRGTYELLAAENSSRSGSRRSHLSASLRPSKPVSTRSPWGSSRHRVSPPTAG